MKTNDTDRVQWIANHLSEVVEMDDSRPNKRRIQIRYFRGRGAGPEYRADGIGPSRTLAFRDALDRAIRGFLSVLLLAALSGCATQPKSRPMAGPTLEQMQADLKAQFVERLHEGMRPEEVKDFANLRCHVSNSIGSWGSHEQWAYTFFDAGRAYLYFDNGTLTSWEISK